MNTLSELFQSDYGLGPTNLPALVLGLLLALIGGHLLAWVYMLTHSGLSYSSSFVKSLVVMPVAVSLVMNVLANNIIVAFGLMAVFAIVRFRNLLRDTLDTTYILLVLVLGMATGSQKFTTAIIGLLFSMCVLLYLWYTAFGFKRRYDLALHFQRKPPLTELEQLEQILRRYCRRFVLTTRRATAEPGGPEEVSYPHRTRDPARADELVRELQSLPGISQVSTVQLQDEMEV